MYGQPLISVLTKDDETELFKKHKEIHNESKMISPGENGSMDETKQQAIETKNAIFKQVILECQTSNRFQKKRRNICLIVLIKGNFNYVKYLSMDWAGLLHSRGKKYTMLLVVYRGTCYSWLLIFPRKPKTADIKKAMDNIITGNYLNAKKKWSYNGTQFTSRNWSQYCKRNGIQRILTAYKNLQSNRITERKIQEVNKKMLMYSYNNKNLNVNQIVQKVMKAVNRTKS
jgi:hypothetical protein